MSQPSDNPPLRHARTCIGCGARAERPMRQERSLLRLVAVAGGLRVDLTGRMPGRGMWLHSRAACVQKAARRRLRAGLSDPSLLSLLERSFSEQSILEQSLLQQRGGGTAST